MTMSGRSWREFRKSFRLEANGLTYAALVGTYILFNRLDEARATAKEARANGVDSPYFHSVYYAFGLSRTIQRECSKR